MHKITDQTLINAIVEDWLSKNDHLKFQGKEIFLNNDGTLKENNGAYAELLRNIVKTHGSPDSIEALRLKMLDDHEELELYGDFDETVCEIAGLSHTAWFEYEECGRQPCAYFDAYDEELKNFCASVCTDGTGEDKVVSFYDVLTMWRRNEIRIGTTQFEFMHE